MFSSRQKPPYVAYLHSDGIQQLQRHFQKSERLPSGTSSSELEHSKLTSSAMERSARDVVPMDLELLQNLVRSETRSTPEGRSRHPPRTANAKPFSDASVQMQTSSRRRIQTLRRRQRTPPKALCSKRRLTMHGSTETKWDARATLRLASKYPEGTTIAERQARLVTIDELRRPPALVRRHEETVRATDRIHDIRLLVPLQHALIATRVDWRHFITENICTSAGKR